MKLFLCLCSVSTWSTCPLLCLFNFIIIVVKCTFVHLVWKRLIVRTYKYEGKQFVIRTDFSHVSLHVVDHLHSTHQVRYTNHTPTIPSHLHLHQVTVFGSRRVKTKMAFIIANKRKEQANRQMPWVSVRRHLFAHLQFSNFFSIMELFVCHLCFM